MSKVSFVLLIYLFIELWWSSVFICNGSLGGKMKLVVAPTAWKLLNVGTLIYLVLNDALDYCGRLVLLSMWNYLGDKIYIYLTLHLMPCLLECNTLHSAHWHGFGHTQYLWWKHFYDIEVTIVGHKWSAWTLGDWWLVDLSVNVLLNGLVEAFLQSFLLHFAECYHFALSDSSIKPFSNLRSPVAISLPFFFLSFWEREVKERFPFQGFSGTCFVPCAVRVISFELFLFVSFLIRPHCCPLQRRYTRVPLGTGWVFCLS